MSLLIYENFRPISRHVKDARIYLRVSTAEQDLTHQTDIEHSTRAADCYIAGVYRDKASGARADRPDLLRLIADLQPGEVVVAEKIDTSVDYPITDMCKSINGLSIISCLTENNR